MRKIRSDSAYASLEPELKDELDEGLLSGRSYTETKQWLSERGVDVSVTSLSSYYQNHVLPAKWARQKTTAALLDDIEIGKIDAATAAAVKQTVFELATSSSGDPRTLKMLYDLVIKADAVALDQRKQDLLERKAAAADAARIALENKVNSGGLSGEALALAEEQLSLL